MKVSEMFPDLGFPAFLQDLRDRFARKELDDTGYWNLAYPWLLSPTIWLKSYQRKNKPHKPEYTPPPTKHPQEGDEEYQRQVKQHDEHEGAIQRAWQSECQWVDLHNRDTKRRLLGLLSWAYDGDHAQAFEQAGERLNEVWRVSDPLRAVAEYRRGST